MKTHDKFREVHFEQSLLGAWSKLILGLRIFPSSGLTGMDPFSVEEVTSCPGKHFLISSKVTSENTGSVRLGTIFLGFGIRLCLVTRA